MSDLGGGRTSSSGPVPVSSNTTTALKTPSDVMRNRREREAKRQEQTRLEEQRRQQQAAEERRRSAERRAAALTGEPRYSAVSSQYSPDVTQGGFAGQRASNGAQVASGADYGVPTGRAQPVPARVTTQAQDQPRAAQPTVANTSRRPQPVRQRQPAQQPAQQQQESPAAEGGAGQAEPPQGSRSSTFPHAFERWEQLSSHWEGLTSYWLRRLEADAEEIVRTVPTAASMSKQINDLSAAGANLFHAVVELQKLRASSERKFQRWFFETRAEIEKNAEIKAQLEKQLQDERTERQRATQTRAADTDIVVENARREVAEMRRELMISKEEARRAWEELGRRNQDSLELAESLKAGRMTIVSGVQVMPIFGGPSRTASANQRPPTRDDVQYDTPGVSAAGAAGFRSPDDEEGYYHDDGSPTGTDPFVERRRPPVLHHEPAVQSLAAGTYAPHSQTVPAPESPARTAPRNDPVNITAAEARQFYQQAPQETFLHSPAVSAQQLRQPHAPTAIADDQTESDWDAEGDPHRQREYEDRYGLGGPAHPTALTEIPPEAPTVPATSAAAMAGYGPTLGAEQGQDEPDYEGAAYAGWESLRAPHHPTRLSDVPEEDEERSSRRTAV